MVVTWQVFITQGGQSTVETKTVPINERLMIGSLLAAAAGGFDAFTYLLHGGVFAGLQTGNLILLGAHLGQGQFNLVWRFVVPILAFVVGTMIARWIQHQAKHYKRPLLQQQMILVWELILIVIVAFFSPSLPDIPVSGLISMAAAAQLQEFRKLKGGPFTSLMMTGNLRTVAEGLYDGIFHHSQPALAKAADIATIIASFVIGAGAMGFTVLRLNHFAILLPGVLLAIIWTIFWRNSKMLGD